MSYSRPAVRCLTWCLKYDVSGGSSPRLMINNGQHNSSSAAQDLASILMPKPNSLNYVNSHNTTCLSKLVIAPDTFYSSFYQLKLPTWLNVTFRKFRCIRACIDRSNLYSCIDNLPSDVIYIFSYSVLHCSLPYAAAFCLLTNKRISPTELMNEFKLYCIVYTTHNCVNKWVITAWQTKNNTRPIYKPFNIRVAANRRKLYSSAIKLVSTRAYMWKLWETHVKRHIEIALVKYYKGKTQCACLI